MLTQPSPTKKILQTNDFQSGNLSHTTIYKRKDGVIETHCTDMSYGVNELMEIVQATGKITGQKRALILVFASLRTLVSSEALKFMATPESVKYSLAEAYVVKSTAQKILVNFYLRFNKPSVPTRFFSDTKKAEKWLLAQGKSQA